jgi:hypothetical protein
MGKLERVGGAVVRTGRAALVALPLLAASSVALAAEPEQWTAIGEQDGVTLFARTGGYDEGQADLAARPIAPAPTPVQILDDGNGTLSFEVPPALAPVGPAAPRPAALFDNGEGVTYFAP